MIASVALLAVFSGLLQIASLGKARDETMNTARRNAGMLALTPLTVPYNADYIHHWDAGVDQSSYSADDTFTYGNEADFRAVIVDEVVGDVSDWAVMDQLTDNPISVLHIAASPDDHLGLVVGSDQRTVPLLPAVRHLLYDAPEITIRSEVWMTSTRGIF